MNSTRIIFCNQSQSNVLVVEDNLVTVIDSKATTIEQLIKGGDMYVYPVLSEVGNIITDVERHLFV